MKHKHKCQVSYERFTVFHIWSRKVAGTVSLKASIYSCTISLYWVSFMSGFMDLEEIYFYSL